jgi:hypothetical protein
MKKSHRVPSGIARITVVWLSFFRPLEAGRYVSIAAFALIVALAASCSSSTPTTPTTVTPSTFVMTWPGLAFPPTGVGSTSPTTVVVTLSNNGTAAVPVASVATSDATQFPFTTTCQVAGSLAPSSTCAVTARFRPTGVGAQSSTLTINANGTTQSLTLTGTGANINPQVTLAAAGDVAPNVFTLTGTGFTPNGLVELHTTYTPAPGNPPNVVPTTTWLADAVGNVTASVTTVAPGVYEHWLLDVTSGVSSNHVSHTVM